MTPIWGINSTNIPGYIYFLFLLVLRYLYNRLFYALLVVFLGFFIYWSDFY